jgi:ribosome-associated heat shock protein Hsp15
MQDASAPVRLDKWLWAARFAKTRGLATELVTGGRVHLNGKAAKPSKEVRPGDELEISLTRSRITLTVTATAERRGSAAAAALLYEETPESRAAREREAELRRATPEPVVGPRPTKRDRRRYERERGGR